MTILWNCWWGLKYKHHLSIRRSKGSKNQRIGIIFQTWKKRKFFRNCLDASKACQDTNVPTKIIKENADIFTDFVHPSINASINNGDFLFLKLANVIPVFKKDSENSKDNYRPINILKNISKLYERILFNQTGTFMDIFFKISMRF